MWSEAVQKLWGLLFLGLDPATGAPNTKGPGVGMGALTPQGGPLLLRYPSQFLSTIHGCGTSLYVTSLIP